MSISNCPEFGVHMNVVVKTDTTNVDSLQKKKKNLQEFVISACTCFEIFMNSAGVSASATQTVIINCRKFMYKND